MNKFLIMTGLLLASSLSFAQNTIIEGNIAPGLRYEKNYIVNSEAEKSLTAGIVSTMGITARTSATANVLSGNYSFELTATNVGQSFTASSTALAGVNGRTCEGSFLYKFGSTTVPFYASVLSGSTTVASATLVNNTGSTSATITHVMTYPCIEGVKPSLQITSTASSALKLYVDKLLVNRFDTKYLMYAIPSTVVDWSIADVYTKTLSANTTFTFANAIPGQNISVRLTNTASNYTVTWPSVRWPAATAPVMTTGAKSDMYTFVFDGLFYYGTVVQDMY